MGAMGLGSTQGVGHGSQHAAATRFNIDQGDFVVGIKAPTLGIARAKPLVKLRNQATPLDLS